MISPRQVSSSWLSDGDGRDGDARGSCGRVFEGVSALCILTLNLGTKRVNSWCQLLSVDAGEMIRNGPQMLSLCAGTKRRIHRQPPQQVLAHVCVCLCMCERPNNRMQRGNTPCIFLPVKARISPEFHFFSFWCYETVRPANRRLATMNKSCESFSGTL